MIVKMFSMFKDFFNLFGLFHQDMYSVPRTILPHGASYNGHPVTLHITYESTKDIFTLEVLEDFPVHYNTPWWCGHMYRKNNPVCLFVCVCHADAQ